MLSDRIENAQVSAPGDWDFCDLFNHFVCSVKQKLISAQSLLIFGRPKCAYLFKLRVFTLRQNWVVHTRVVFGRASTEVAAVVNGLIDIVLQRPSASGLLQLIKRSFERNQVLCERNLAICLIRKEYIH